MSSRSGITGGTHEHLFYHPDNSFHWLQPPTVDLKMTHIVKCTDCGCNFDACKEGIVHGTIRFCTECCFKDVDAEEPYVKVTYPNEKA